MKLIFFQKDGLTICVSHDAKEGHVLSIMRRYRRDHVGRRHVPRAPMPALPVAFDRQR